MNARREIQSQPTWPLVFAKSTGALRRGLLRRPDHHVQHAVLVFVISHRPSTDPHDPELVRILGDVEVQEPSTSLLMTQKTVQHSER